MAKLPYFKMYPADAETDANFRLMDDAERGFYWRCLNHCWMNGGLPSNPDERSRMLNTPRKIADRYWLRVGRCFVTLRDVGLVVNPRQEREREEVIAKSESAAKSARSKGKRSTNDARTLSERLANEGIRAYDSDSDVSVVGSEERKEYPNIDGELAFERLYSAHPKRGDRGLAMHYLAESVANGVSLDLIEEMHGRYCREVWTGKQGQFAPKLAQWLLDKGYNYPPTTITQRDPMEDV